MPPLKYNYKKMKALKSTTSGTTCLADNADGACDTLTGVNVVTNTFLGKVMVVGLYVNAAAAKTKLSKYKNLPGSKVYSDQLKNDLIAGDLELSLEWDFVLSNFSPVPTSIMADHFQGNLKPYLQKYKLGKDEITSLLNLYIKRCFDVANINPKDVARFTWNVKEKALSCNYNGGKYTSISADTQGVDFLAKAIFEFTLDYNKNYVVDLLPHLWSWN